MVSNTVFKVISTIAIFALTLFAALLPYKLRANKRFLSVCNVIAGGIFLGAGLCHLLADSVEQFNEYYEHHDHDDHDHDHDHNDHHNSSQLTHGGEDSHFPWPFLTMGAAFLITMFIEMIAHWLLEDKSEKPNNNNTSATDPLLVDSDYLADPSVNTQQQQDSTNLISSPENSFYSHFSEQSQDNHGHNHQHHSDDDHHGHNHDDEHGHSHLPIHTKNQSWISVIALSLALSFHSIIEGLSFGSSKGDTSKSIMIAILAHKGLESFSLGTSLINSNASTFRYLLFSVLFACMTPLGVIIGHNLTSNHEGLLSAFLCAFAAGTFVYVAVVEVLIPEFRKKHDKLIKCIGVAAGFGGMALLAIWV